jgi:hypothetical protein
MSEYNIEKTENDQNLLSHSHTVDYTSAQKNSIVVQIQCELVGIISEEQIQNYSNYAAI